MIAEELATFIARNVPTFRVLEVVGPGVGFHYTYYSDAIERSGRFFGAPIDEELDRTQFSLASVPAKHDPGVVFAYENFADAAEEGWGCEVYEIQYKKAVLASHMQEELLGAPPTLLILTSEISSFKHLGTHGKS
jgi:hypothetical protein